MNDSDLLHPLYQFYRAAGLPLPAVSLLEGEAVPEPYRGLLMHGSDMTSTLEKFHQQQIHLRVLDMRDGGDTFSREVVLVLDSNDKPVEFGAIILYMDRFAPDVQDLIRACGRPLGGILNSQSIEYASRPRAFFRLNSDSAMNEALRLEGPHTLYGRRNTLFDREEQPLADIVEILPPV